ncbi:unnamed protein product [Mucor hiemalis]
MNTYLRLLWSPIYESLVTFKGSNFRFISRNYGLYSLKSPKHHPIESVLAEAAVPVADAVSVEAAAPVGAAVPAKAAPTQATPVEVANKSPVFIAIVR